MKRKCSKKHLSQMDQMSRHSWTMFITERLKDRLHNPTLITHNPLSSPHKQSQQLERALNSSTQSLSNQGISPREKKGDEAQGATLIWERLGLPCGPSPWWSRASAPVSLKGVNTIANTGIRNNDPPGRSTDDPVNNSSSIHDLPGGFS